MENRRKTRGRPTLAASAAASTTTNINKRGVAAAPAKRASPVRTRSSPARRASPPRTKRNSPPVRRSSRPRSTVLGASASTTTTATISPASPIKEAKEPKQTSSKSSRNNLPTTMTTNTSTRAPGKLQTTSSTHSSYSSTTQRTVEIRSSSSTIDVEIAKLTDYIRRSLSVARETGATPTAEKVREGTHTPTTTNTDSRYSRSVSRTVYDDDNYSKAEFSDNENKEGDDDEDEHYKSFDATVSHQRSSQAAAGLSQWNTSAANCRKLVVPREFGGWLGASVLLLLTPCLVYYLQWCCTKAAVACTFKPLNLSSVIDVKYLTQKVFVGEVVGSYLGFNLGIFVLSAVLFGKRVRLPGSDRASLEYKFNALPVAVVVSIAAGIAEYLKYPVADFVLKHYLRYCIYGFVNAFIVALWCYIRADMLKGRDSSNTHSTQLNVYGKSGNFLIDYALGRQVNPKWLGFVEFKQVFYRISLISTLLFAECFIYKTVQIPWLPVGKEGLFNIVQYYVANIKYDPSTLLTAGLLLAYVADSIIFEHHLASSFELQGEGFGCLLLLRYAATPFLLSSVAKYFFDRRITLTCKYAVYVAVALLTLGLIVKRLSCAIKYKYRVNPNHPLFYGIETIPTFQGRRLLLGPLWGRLRQPNYAGDVLALIGLGSPLFLQFVWPPAIGLLLCIALLVHRSVRVNTRNSSRYHSSWVRYCSMVRNYIIPKVF